MAAWARNLFSIIILMKARRLTLCHAYSWCPKTGFREHRAIAAFPLSQTTSRVQFTIMLLFQLSSLWQNQDRNLKQAQMIFANRRTGGKKEKKKETNKQNPAFFEKQLGEETQCRACQSRFFFQLYGYSSPNIHPEESNSEMLGFALLSSNLKMQAALDSPFALNHNTSAF